MSIAVLGCGPAGLMAAHAVAQSGVEPVIYSRKQKSPLYGAQYLHAPIPGVTDRDDAVTVEYLTRGTPEDYRRKVYGRTWDGTVSPEDLSEMHTAWDIRSTYEALWDEYSRLVVNVDIDPGGVRIILDNPDHSMVVNTIPLVHLCHAGHTFMSQTVWAAGDAPDLGIDIGKMFHCPPNTVICNGEETPSWYRISNIFGHTTVEWPDNSKPPVSTVSRVLKPTSHDCSCWPQLFNVGRYGSWTKGVLSHSAYFKTLERIEHGAPAQAEA